MKIIYIDYTIFRFKTIMGYKSYDNISLALENIQKDYWKTFYNILLIYKSFNSFGYDFISTKEFNTKYKKSYKEYKLMKFLGK